MVLAGHPASKKSVPVGFILGDAVRPEVMSEKMAGRSNTQCMYVCFVWCQNKVGEMTWKHWDTCSCTFYEVVFRGKD